VLTSVLASLFHQCALLACASIPTSKYARMLSSHFAVLHESALAPAADCEIAAALGATPMMQPVAAPPAAPLGEVGISWPSLGDAKVPVKKKERPDAAVGTTHQVRRHDHRCLHCGGALPACARSPGSGLRYAAQDSAPPIDARTSEFCNVNAAVPGSVRSLSLAANAECCCACAYRRLPVTRISPHQALPAAAVMGQD